MTGCRPKNYKQCKFCGTHFPCPPSKVKLFCSEDCRKAYSVRHRKEYGRTYYHGNRDKLREQLRIRLEAQRGTKKEEKRLAHIKAYGKLRRARPEAKSRHAELERIRRASNPESYRLYDKNRQAKKREQARIRYQKDRALYALKRRAYRQANIEHEREVAKEWRKKNPDKVKQYDKDPVKIRKRASLRRARKRMSVIGDVEAIERWERFWKSRKSVRCHWCGNRFPGKRCHADHVIPLSKGGSHSLENLVISCQTCNLRKQAKDPADWNKQLKQPLLIV